MSRLVIPLLFTFALAVLPNTVQSADKTFVVTTEEWPPFVAAELADDGWAMEVVRAALEPQGYDVSLELVPWARAVRCAKSGKCDGLYLAYYSDDRTQWFAYSDPIGEVRTGFFKLKNSDIDYAELPDLKEYKIGLTRGAAVSEEFDSADYLNKVEVNNDVLNVRKLLRGRVDLVAAADPVFVHMINTSVSEEEASRIEFMEPPLSRQDLHMAISKQASDYERKLQDFNAGLERIRADGTYEAILQEHGF